MKLKIRIPRNKDVSDELETIDPATMAVILALLPGNDKAVCSLEIKNAYVGLNAVKSSNVSRVGYDEGTLAVLFTGGGLYLYFDVPKSTYETLMNSDSIGRALSANVTKAGFEFVRVGELSDE